MFEQAAAVRVRSRDADAPGLCKSLFPRKTEGAGNTGCPLHPQPRVVCRKHAR